MTTASKFKSVTLWLLAVLLITMALVAAFWNSLVPVVATGVNIVRHWGAPAGTLGLGLDPIDNGAADDCRFHERGSCLRFVDRRSRRLVDELYAFD